MRSNDFGGSVKIVLIIFVVFGLWILLDFGILALWSLLIKIKFICHEGRPLKKQVFILKRPHTMADVLAAIARRVVETDKK
jgi:hypothetical protein